MKKLDYSKLYVELEQAVKEMLPVVCTGNDPVTYDLPDEFTLVNNTPDEPDADVYFTILGMKYLCNINYRNISLKELKEHYPNDFQTITQDICEFFIDELKKI